MNNDLPWFNGAFYVALDGSPLPDYDAAYAYNVSLVSNAYSAFYNPDSPLYAGQYDVNNTPAAEDSPTEVLAKGSAGPIDSSGGWNFLTTALGTTLTTVGSIAKTKLDTQMQILTIQQQGKIKLADQQATQDLLAAQKKYNLNATPKPADTITPMQWLAIGAAVIGIGFAFTQR